MWFFIGVIVFILFIVFGYLYLRYRFQNMLRKLGFINVNLENIIDEVKNSERDTPKSLASMDSIYLEQIKKDFPDININELKREAERVILDCYNSIERGNTSSLSGKIKSFADSMISDFDGKKVSFDSFKIHNTVVSSYKKDKGSATIYFASSYEYFNSESLKVQDRAKVEFIYIIDKDKVKGNVVGISCPNCGSPITSLGEKKCSYCGSAVKEIIGRVFYPNDIVRY